MSNEEKLLKRIRIGFFFAIIIGAIGLTVVQWVLTHPRKQPIAFKHSLHVGVREISCYYCHTGVEHGDIAGVISVQDCMQCHQVVATDNAEVQKLTGYWEKKQPIYWSKIYKMPKHVHFSHQTHVAYLSKKYPGRLACNYCHGDLGRMDVVKPAHNFSMGFCVDCHNANGATMDCTACHR